MFSLTATLEGQMLIDERFDDGFNNWWVEGAKRVWVEDERLHVDADAPPGEDGCVATVWHRTPVGGNLKIEFDAHCVSSSIGANNINFFLLYSDPSGKPLEDTRDDRDDAGYAKYHDLNGYIFTFLRDRRFEDGKTPSGKAKARFRMRKCPGFNLIDESFDESGCETGITYHVTITLKDGVLKYFVDGKQFMKATDETPWREGLIGLRTFCTYLWWDNIKVTKLGE